MPTSERESDMNTSTETQTSELRILTKPNKYAGKCERCEQPVRAHAGLLAKRSDGSWAVVHENPQTCELQRELLDEATALIERDDLDETIAAVTSSPTTSSSSTFEPTDEQRACLDLFTSGESMVIEAGAGTGKTSTLLLLAESTQRRGVYVAFNKAIVEEAKRKMPSHVYCTTAHSLAYQTVVAGTAFADRLKRSARVPSREVAQRLDMHDFVCQVGEQTKRLGDSKLGGLVMSTLRNYCQTADPEPLVQHVPYVEGLDFPSSDGRRTYRNNNELAAYVFPFVQRAWADLVDPRGELPFKHEHYLKLWQLSHPTINADFILFDEAQDANPVMAAVIAEQTHAQLVYVGDSQQAIYEFTGAVNALGKIDSRNRRFLTQSFRFGTAIAETANVLLGQLDAELRLQGTPSIDSSLGAVSGRRAVLTRTNACGIDTLLKAIDNGQRVHFVGGGDDVVRFARAAADLMNGRSTTHPDLACFSDWGEVQSYVTDDEQGGELQLLVKLVDDYGPQTIIRALDHNDDERSADLIVSTAHKSKGREWDHVVIGDDFLPKQKRQGNEPVELSPSELRLLYVAVTRARLRLDCSAIDRVLAA